MSCNIKHITNKDSVADGNLGNDLILELDFYQCSVAPDYYLILEESTEENEIPLFSQHPRFIEVFEEDIA